MVQSTGRGYAPGAHGEGLQHQRGDVPTPRQQCGALLQLLSDGCSYVRVAMDEPPESDVPLVVVEAIGLDGRLVVTVAQDLRLSLTAAAIALGLMAEEKKRCRQCRRSFPLAAYSNDISRPKDGLSPACRPCERRRLKVYAAKRRAARGGPRKRVEPGVGHIGGHGS